MLRIGFDLDNCLSRTSEAALASLISKGLVQAGTTIDDATWLKWEWDQEAGTGFPGVTFEDMRAVFMEPAFWLGLETHQFPASLVRDIGRDAEIHIVTDRRWFPELEALTRQWLDEHFIPYDQLVICKGTEKGGYCDQAMLDIFVEDSAENAVALAPNVVSVYLAEKVWNAGTELPVNCLRAPWDVIGSDLFAQVDTDMHMCIAQDILCSTWLSRHIRNQILGTDSKAA